MPHLFPWNALISKIPWAHSEDTEVAEVKDLETQNDNKSKWKLVKTRWKPKFGLSDLENDLLASTTSDEARWIFSKITFLKSVHQAEARLSSQKFRNTSFLLSVLPGHNEAAKKLNFFKV